ncbi:hypothetical protein [Capnocytophaga catalasegens]|uniref:Lipoprotein n=1 Tax=Capnocytophaga catalasegens TaxID=1004260 RepID=A0AAV5AXC0_9FLAO|nr:hypothetical protein [Capnocytophaga catalasegens]GIZ14948.1 hypothetical protein RCZ03_09480 [Capnocytophaga catalasegens]GJM49327.1 hypothetical protein RCZ15_03020 [Capnocytophaga catalasegens]GJM52478.1 hypothetical protein RCZ16_07950 [Capnocytophaga catalasegens]
MKRTIKFLSFLSLVVFTLIACSKNDDPTDNDLFVGTYEGSVSYIKGNDSKSNDNGKVTIAKVGDKYNFIFSDDIPSITGVEIKDGKAYKIDLIGGDSQSIITISKSDLTILFIKEGATWKANCKR